MTTGYIIIHDPGEYPLCPGLWLSSLEMNYMRRYGCFEDGTVVESRSSGFRYQVVGQKLHRIPDVEVARMEEK